MESDQAHTIVFHMKCVDFLGALLVWAMAGGWALAQDKVGIQVCDTFLEKYQACVKGKAGDQRARLDQMIGQLRTQWKQLADDPQTKGAVEGACKESIEQAKSLLNAAPYNCGF